ncbi:hypothetical protein CS0771_35760 [Catellatospora sp. IY07-71]|uniref:hypothetical protein n=1 Tax=Catellatospora sp. IY07-71 TaxID=2728827 RepID=UPI001BB6D72E|nr:hypothetical protein [Catellatospora sp. IY07-71]BCJ74032.1 hypothetical protein CS0771_35760 [Catellatospora sp. IY07-71]
MHHVNHFYGHAAILGAWCGLTDPQPRVRGYLQHGWNIGDGWELHARIEGHDPLLVWSEQTRRRAWSLGRRNVFVLGAPWAYLLRMAPEKPAARAGTVFYPFHGWEKQEVLGDHRRLVDTIRAVETEPVTICLHWNEYTAPRVRDVYERAGFEVVCHGRRGWGRRDGDPDFLHRQLATLRRHRRVASNRLSTAVLYGITAGCEPAVYGDPMTLDGEDQTMGGAERVRRQWAPLHGEQVDLATARAIAHDELGLAHLASPAELRALLGWPEPPGADAPPGLPARATTADARPATLVTTVKEAA